MISIQIRRYRADGTYLMTNEAVRPDNLVANFLNSHLECHSSWFEFYLPITPCNIMLRRKGKLISYKEFYNV